MTNGRPVDFSTCTTAEVLLSVALEVRQARFSPSGKHSTMPASRRIIPANLIAP